MSKRKVGRSGELNLGPSAYQPSSALPLGQGDSLVITRQRSLRVKVALPLSFSRLTDPSELLAAVSG